MNVGANIKELRVKKEMTQDQLAEKVGVSKMYISMLERGTKVVSLQLAIDIAEILGCKLCDIVGREV